MTLADTHIIIELPFGNKVPTQSQILKRLKKLYVENKPLLPILTACAEEVETMMHELFISSTEHEVVIRRTQGSKGYSRKKGYFCPDCHMGGINTGFKFCPHCGKLIYWH